jgi:hypothetical protein
MSPLVAIATFQGEPGLYAEEKGILPLLQARGVQAEAAVWNDPAVAWDRYDMVVLRSIWDYFEREKEFRRWLANLESSGVRIENPLPLVRWNMDKHYLGDLAARGARVVPTRFIEPGEHASLTSLMREREWTDAILKPAVSGNGHRTHRVRADSASDQSDLDALLNEGIAALLQPFVPQIQSEGEWSLVFFGGSYSHAVVKKPLPGEFRVQERFGGTWKCESPSPALIAEAARIVDLLVPRPLYVRIDGVVIQSEFQLMEVEAIEPYLFTAGLPEALDRYADAIAAAVRASPALA